jgi:hypothetical protein
MALHMTSTGLSGGNWGAELDDYEEGTWTADCGSGVSLQAHYDLGGYTKWGRMVNAGGQFLINNSNGGQAMAYNMPFTSRANTSEGHAYDTCSVRCHSVDFGTDFFYVMAYIGGSTAVLEIQACKDNVASEAVAADDASYFMFGLTYTCT